MPHACRALPSLCLFVAAVALSGGCAADSTGDGPCLTGSRVCEGDVVMLCTAEAGAFVSEYTCPTTMECLGGECVAQHFEGGGGGGLPDAAGPDASPDPEPDVAAPGADVHDTTPELPWPEPDLVEIADAAPPAPDLEVPGPEPDPEPELPAPEPDPEPEVVAPPPDLPWDPGPPDEGPPIEDTEPLDVGPIEDVVALEDHAAPPVDHGGPVADHGSPPADHGPPFPEEVPFSSWTHLPQYAPIPNILVQGDLHRVRWHPGGEWALLASPGGELLRYDAGTGGLAPAGDIGASISDLEVQGEGDFFLALGKAGDHAHVWRLTPDEAGTGLVIEDELDLGQGDPGGLAVDGSGHFFALSRYEKIPSYYIDTVYLWRDGQGILSSGAYNAPGVRDVMFADVPALYAGSLAIVTADGVNGAGSHTYVVDADAVVSNNWKGSFGNPGGAAWRPGGGYGILTGWTSNKLYVFDGAWTLATLPGVPTGGSPNAVGWRPDGGRALIVGRAVGSPLEATVVDHRPLQATGFNAAALLDVSIQGFGVTPWFGNSNVHLLDVDWRPGTLCDEGLIVGTDNGTSWSPTFGLALRFVDPDDPWCELP